jgi:hypothetical protein
MRLGRTLVVQDALVLQRQDRRPVAEVRDVMLNPQPLEVPPRVRLLHNGTPRRNVAAERNKTETKKRKDGVGTNQTEYASMTFIGRAKDPAQQIGR